jgi:hypothetical protein
MNDEHEWDPETPEQRHARIRRWAVANLAVDAKAVR